MATKKYILVDQTRMEICKSDTFPKVRKGIAVMGKYVDGDPRKDLQTCDNDYAQLIESEGYTPVKCLTLMKDQENEK